MFRQLCQYTSVCLATLGMLLLPPVLRAEGLNGATPAVQSAVTDIALSAGGTLHGRVLGEQGQPIDGAVVTLRRGEVELGRVTSNTEGEFQFANLRSGVYVVETPVAQRAIRAWSPEVAPPGSKQSVLMAQQTVMRGQLGFLDPVSTTTLILGIAGVTLGGIAVADISDVKDIVERLPTSP